jgi:Tol biopolymer transport system component
MTLVRRAAPAVLAAAASAGALAATLEVGVLEMASVTHLGTPGLGTSGEPALGGAGGRFVAFSTDAALLPGEEFNGSFHVYLRDLAAGTTVLVSSNPEGVRGNSHSFTPNVSANGRYVLFLSEATDLVAGEEEPTEFDQAYLADLRTGEIRRISDATGGGPGNGDSNTAGASLSPNGRWAAFSSGATDLVEDEAPLDGENLFLHDRVRGTVRRVTEGADGHGIPGTANTPSVTPNGRWVSFNATGTGLVPDGAGGFHQAYLADLRRGTVERLSSAEGGGPGGHHSAGAVVTPNGRIAAFYSHATNLPGTGENGIQADVLVLDRRTGAYAEASRGPAGEAGSGHSYSPALSPDGRHVAFYSTSANLVAGDGNGVADVFLRDLRAGTTRRVSEAADGTSGDGESYLTAAGLSADGKWLAFASSSTTFAAGTEDHREVYVVRLR